MPSGDLIVVSGIIIRSGRILLTQRLPGKDFEFAWECAGGKTSAKEACFDALVRELNEELGITVFDAKFISKHFFGDMPQGVSRINVSLWMYHVTEFIGQPAAREGQGLGWFDRAEIQKLTLAPGNVAALPKILNLMEKSK